MSILVLDQLFNWSQWYYVWYVCII